MLEEGSPDAGALRSLAQFQPFEGDGDRMEAAHDDLVTAACQSNGGSFENLSTLKSFIGTKWKTDLEIHELEAARTRLEAAGRVESQNGRVELSESASNDLELSRRRWEQAETTAVEEWEAAVRLENPLLSSDQIALLREQLRPWLDQVIVRHGAEASLLLYPEHPRSRALVDSLANVKLDFLPDCGAELNSLRPEVFRLLIREPTPAQREFLGRLLNTGFYLTVLSMDPRARHLVQDETRQTAIYLDTNFLYAALGVGTRAEATAAKRLLELCKELGYSLLVSPWTVEELRTSIAKSKGEVSSIHQSQKAAQVMAEVSGEKGFAPAFWRESRDSNVDAKTFFAKYDQYERFLEGLGIKAHPQGCEAVDSDVQGIRQYASPLEGLYGVGNRPRVVIEHKAKMRMLIEQLRGSARPSSFSDVRYWFLTESTMLPSYARMPIMEQWRPRFPFCILSSSLAQVVRAMVPRTADLNDMIVGLLASPYVGYRTAVQGVHLKAVERVVARIDSLSDVPAAVAVAMVNDQAMAAQVGGETNDDLVDELVEQSLSEKAKQLELRFEETADQVVTAESDRATAREEAEDAKRKQDAADAERARAAEEARLATQRATAAAQEREEEAAAKQRAESAATEIEVGLKAEIAEAKGREDSERKRREETERRLRTLRNVAAIASIVLIGGGIAALLATGAVSGWAPVIALIAATVLACYAAARIISATLAKELVIALSIIVGVVTAAAAIVPPD